MEQGAWSALANGVKEITHALKEHPDALLTFILTLMGAVMLSIGINPWVSTCFPASMFIMYISVKLFYYMHIERLKELEITELESRKRIEMIERENKISELERR